jgi:hypothetical protein
MSRLDDYRSALLAANTDVPAGVLERVLDDSGTEFVTFVVDHGLGPLWHVRTGRDEFHSSRLSAEALYLAQEHALKEIDSVLEKAGIEYAVIKGAASRVLLHANPAIRAGYDLDLLVRPDDRVRTAAALIEANFIAQPEARNISRELVLCRDVVDIDLHWGLLREGRLRSDPTADLVDRRRREKGIWMLNAEDALFVLLVHPAFGKHLAGWGMGLHRVADIVVWLGTQAVDLEALCQALRRQGVATAAWATLRWVELLTQPNEVPGLQELLSALRPGRVRRAWLNFWLSRDLPQRTTNLRWVRLMGFSVFLHDALGDSVRALTGRYRAHQRRYSDQEAFRTLLDE